MSFSRRRIFIPGPPLPAQSKAGKLFGEGRKGFLSGLREVRDRVEMTAPPWPIATRVQAGCVHSVAR